MQSINCKNPYIKTGHAFGCGQCMLCRVNKSRVWTHRLMLEAALQTDNCFLTLTYSDENLPSELVPRDLQLFLKKLRKTLAPNRFRFFAVGEYGDQTLRPHYHVALFGVPTCEYGLTRTGALFRSKPCCPRCLAMSQVWGKGHCYLGRIETQSARYISGYVVKKLTDAKDERLEGRHPEFARMSNRPGIGCHMMDELASTLLQHSLDTLPDVPATLAHGSARWPLGRYLRRKLRQRIGRDEKAPLHTIQKMEETLRPLREASQANALPGFKTFAFKGAIQDASKAKRIQIEAKFRRTQKRGSL